MDRVASSPNHPARKKITAFITELLKDVSKEDLLEISVGFRIAVALSHVAYVKKIGLPYDQADKMICAISRIEGELLHDEMHIATALLYERPMDIPDELKNELNGIKSIISKIRTDANDIIDIVKPI